MSGWPGVFGGGIVTSTSGWPAWRRPCPADPWRAPERVLARAQAGEAAGRCSPRSRAVERALERRVVVGRRERERRVGRRHRAGRTGHDRRVRSVGTTDGPRAVSGRVVDVGGCVVEHAPRTCAAVPEAGEVTRRVAGDPWPPSSGTGSVEPAGSLGLELEARAVRADRPGRARGRSTSAVRSVDRPRLRRGRALEVRHVVGRADRERVRPSVRSVYSFAARRSRPTPRRRACTRTWARRVGAELEARGREVGARVGAGVDRAARCGQVDRPRTRGRVSSRRSAHRRWRAHGMCCRSLAAGRY